MLKNIKEYVPPIKAHNAGIVKVDQLELTGRTTNPSDSDLANGRIYYNSSSDILYGRIAGAWVNLGQGGAGGPGSLDALYSVDQTLTISSATLTFAGTHATNDVVTFTNASGSGDCIQITNSGSGSDIEGTSGTWSVSAAGAAVFTAVTGCDTLTAAANLAIDATGAGTITLAGTSTGAITLTTATACSAALTVGTTLTVGTGLTLSDGLCDLIDNSNAASALRVTNDTQSTYGNASDAGMIVFRSESLTTGALLHLTLDETNLTTGSFLRCWGQDAGAAVFSIGEYGATVIAGSAGGTDAFTITAGDILIDDSDENIIESEDGTLNLLLLDNKAGAVGSGKAVLYVDAGGVVNAAGYGIYATFSGAAAAGATVIGVVPDAGSLGIKVAPGAVDTRELLYLDSDPTAYDVAYIHSDAVIASDKALLTLQSAGAVASGGNVFRVDVTGTPASGAIYCEFDFAGFTDTASENIGLLIDAGGKKVRALDIDADPVANDVVKINCDSVIAADKGALQIVTTGAIAAGGTAMRFDITGAPDADARVLEFDLAGITDTNEPYAIFIDGGGKKIRALYIDADPVTNDLVYIHSDAIIADNKALVNIHQATGIMAGGSSLLRLECDSTPAASFALQEIDMTGITATNNPAGIFVNGVGKDVTAMLVDVDNTDITAVSIDGSGAISGANMLRVDNDGIPAANTDAVVDFRFTGTATNTPRILNIYGTGKDCQGIIVDTDNTATNSVGITGTGNLNAGNMLFVGNDGIPAANTDAMVKFAFTGTATNDPINLFIDHNSIGAAISIDQDGNDGTDPAIGIKIDTDNAGAGNQIALDVDQVDESKSYFARFNATTAWTSTKNPETDAESGWLAIMVGTTKYLIPYYSVS